MNSHYPTRLSRPVSLQPDIAMTANGAWLSAQEIMRAVTAGKVSAVSVTEAALARIARHDPVLNSFTDVTADRARAKARAVDAAVAAGQNAGPLAGVPFAVKNLFDVQGLPTRAGSKINRDRAPAPRDATLIERMEAAGAVLVGALNMGEYAYDFTGENSHDGPSRNPHDVSRMTGGSSGGSGGAVGGGLVPLALGSDTNGSIRVPSSFCGIFGLKPTYGRVSRYGLIAFASSLDHIGPFANTVKDAALILRTIAGRDPMDSTSTEIPVPDYVAELEKPVKGLRVGVAKEYFGAGLDPEVRAVVEAAIQKLAELGCEVVSVSLPHTEYAIPTYYIVATAEASSNLARFDGVRYGFRAKANTLSEMYRQTRDGGFGVEVKRRIMLGTYALSAGYYDAYYLKAQKVRTLLTRDFHEAFKKVDVIATPTCPTPAFKLGEKIDDPLAMYLADIYTVTANLAGIPGISIPCGENHEKLPIGLQLFAGHFDEGTLLRVAYAYEQGRP